MATALRYAVQQEIDHGEKAPDSGISVVKVARELLASAPRNGAELTNVAVPASILDPVSALQKPMKAMKRGELLPRLFGPSPAPSPWREAPPARAPEPPLARFLAVVEFVLAGYPVEKFGKKPYNPILGEVFRAAFQHEDPAHGVTLLFAEQVSHHPPVSAIHWRNDTLGMQMNSVARPTTRFWGNSIEIRIGGTATLLLKGVGADGEDEEYFITRPTVYQSGILGVGKQRVEFVGESTISCAQTGLELTLEFKANKMLGMRGDINAIHGKIKPRTSDEAPHSRNGSGTLLSRATSRSGVLGGGAASGNSHVLAEICGRWDGEVTVTFPGQTGKSSVTAVLYDYDEAKRTSSMQVWLPEEADWEDNNSLKVWSECSRAIWNQDTRLANDEKKKVEEWQREVRRKREHDGDTFAPIYFEPDQEDYRFRSEILKGMSFSVGNH